MADWRWDQGRLEYFRFDNIKAIARGLVSLEGTTLSGSGVQDPLRNQLVEATGLAFRVPSTHSIWRNYSRVFQCSFLCANVDGKLLVTELARRLADPEQSMDVDEYMAHILPRFSFPFPAFQNYSITDAPVFPFCAAFKYLLAAYHKSGGEWSLSLDEIFSLLLGNRCTGIEDLWFYQNLSFTNRAPIGEERRQVREMFLFASQSSFLKWHNNRLYLDILAGDAESVSAFEGLSQPITGRRKSDAAQELLRLGLLGSAPPENITAKASWDTTRRQPADVLFTEGARERVTHLRIERSPYLRRRYFDAQQKPHHCDMCGCDPRKIYPWLTDFDNILEVHHLLPLSSALIITTTGTSFDDIVSLCPNCHRSIHSFYKKWLNSRKRNDFSSKQEAKTVYESAKGQYAP